MHTSSLLNMQSFVDKYLAPMGRSLKIADIGSQVVEGQVGEGSYKKCFGRENWEYVGCDMVPGNNVDIVFKNPYAWDEIKNGTFDVVVSGQALEHVEYIWVTVMEMERILKEGGLCCLIVPSSGYAHMYPIDCWRFLEGGLAALAKWARMDIIEVFTQRCPEDFGQYDPIWQDSVLICQKPRRTWRSKIKFMLAYKAGRLMAPLSL